jgi:copper homeostasis protein (lipoprotein)
MRRTTCLLVFSCLLVAGCNRDRDGGAPGAAQSTPPLSSSDFGSGEAMQDERTWVGLLPCSDCQGIDTRLVLRAIGRRRDYLLTETYLGGTGKNSFNRAGTWVEVSDLVDGQPATLYILDPDQGGLRFSLQPDGALELLEGNDKSTQDVAYRLQRL